LDPLATDGNLILLRGNPVDEYLWPARNVAEYAYCPRLFYYMEVEGLHLASDDTEKGQYVHRRVDSPSNATSPTEDSDEPKAVRSLTLTSPRLKLTATLDLAEINGSTAIPVEYRKGRSHHRHAGDRESDSPDAVEPWPTDRVHVGLQACLLEEAGYSVPEAVLYYAAEKRRVTVPVDDQLRRDALEALTNAKNCAAGARPLPLINDPRCPRCSLLPICLPDEVNLARDASATSPSARKLWPPRDDGIHIVAQQEGAKLGVRGAAMTVTDKNGTKLKDVPLANVESVSLVGSVQVSTQALHTLSERGIPVAFLSAAGRITAMVDPLDSVSADTRRAQVRRFDDPAACLSLSQALVTAKIVNQRTLLMRNHQALPPRLADDLSQQVELAQNATSIDSLRGHEGQAGALYFGNFAGMVKGELAAEFDANGRQRRPPPDPINSALSFAYSMLTHECTAALRVARLEPAIGAFHVSRPGRPALALDLMEPFRPLIADSIVITAVNRGELQPGHFLRTAAGCAFTDAGRKAFFGVYGRRMADEVTHPVFGYKLSYRRMIILHARMIAAWLQDEVPTLSFLTTR
jgi:CRISPR-associated protein Cas1